MLEIPVEGQGMKPEVLLLLKDDPAAYRVLVMHDHIAGGCATTIVMSDRRQLDWPDFVDGPSPRRRAIDN